MKTKKLIRLIPVLVLAAGISISGCKKDEKETTKPDSSSVSQLSEDENQVSASADEIFKDADNFLSDHSDGKSLPCNFTYDSVKSINGDTITYQFHYNGNNCENTFHVKGELNIVKLISKHWIEAGTTVTLKFINIEIRKLSNNKTVILNGEKTYENESGGLVITLDGTGSVVHKVSGTLTVKFEDGTVREWSIARKKTFTGSFLGHTIVLAVEGFGSADGYDNLETYGTNREGEKFYTQISTPVVIKETCGWDPCSGMMVLQLPSEGKSATVSFGYDSNNEPIAEDDCPARFRIDWNDNGSTGTIFLPLP